MQIKPTLANENELTVGIMPNVPASRDYEGGFGSDLMAKDVSLAVAAAHTVKASHVGLFPSDWVITSYVFTQAPLPLGASALQVYNLISAKGLGGKDFGVVYDFLKKH